VASEAAFGVMTVKTGEAGGTIATASETAENAVLRIEQDEVDLEVHPVDTAVGET
jgi:hypothetical protein